MPRNRIVISEAYRSMQQELHGDPGYGVASRAYAPVIRDLLAEFGGRSVSDYGAGKQNLKLALTALGVAVDYRPYDPAFPEYGEPQPADLVCCIDVLEHVEPELLDNVLDELQDLVTAHGLFTVHTGPASKLLGDGRNAHLVQQPKSWWLPRFERRFEVVRVTEAPGGFVVLVRPRPNGARRRETTATAVPAPIPAPTRIAGQMDLQTLLSVLARYLAGTPTGARGLNLTAGGDPLKGWLNVGAVAVAEAEMIHNLAHGLSFLPPECMARIYSEALLEDLPQAAALRLLKDANAALVTGGVIRIALWGGANRSSASDVEPTAHHQPAPVPYDVESIGSLLQAAGFVDITSQAYGASNDPGLAGLERREPAASSLILEARKPAAG
jgi:hypothetical protein